MPDQTPDLRKSLFARNEYHFLRIYFRDPPTNLFQLCFHNTWSGIFSQIGNQPVHQLCPFGR